MYWRVVICATKADSKATKQRFLESSSWQHNLEPVSFSHQITHHLCREDLRPC